MGRCFTGDDQNRKGAEPPCQWEVKNPPLEEGRMEERGKKFNQSDNLLFGIDPGKEELYDWEIVA